MYYVCTFYITEMHIHAIHSGRYILTYYIIYLLAWILHWPCCGQRSQILTRQLTCTTPWIGSKLKTASHGPHGPSFDHRLVTRLHLGSPHTQSLAVPATTSCIWHSMAISWSHTLTHYHELGTPFPLGVCLSGTFCHLTYTINSILESSGHIFYSSEKYSFGDS